MADIKVIKPTSELIEKAKAAASPEEILEIAKNANISLSAESAGQLFDRLHPAEEKISIDDLDNVAGGCSDEEVPEIGDVVDVTCFRCQTWGPTFEGMDSQGRYCVQCHFCGNYWCFFA
ncbi:MAG: hypothetical protein Q4B54_04200 [Coriobacteriales bacterium]|nr:hypothetical protein [Coriobacteriales bacterium]